jgi:hypothetical protein
MRIDSSGNVGIGTSASYGGRLATVPGTTPTTVAGANQIQIGENTSNTAYRMQLGYFNNGANGFNGSIQVYDNNNAEDLILNGAGGNVGVGTSTPTNRLEVTNSTTSGLVFRVQNQSTAQFAGSGILCSGPSAAGVQGAVGFYYYNTNVGGTTGAAAIAQFDVNGSFQRNLATYDFNSQYWNFSTNGTERMRIDSSGNVGIGTSAPGNRLDIVGTSSSQIRVKDGIGGTSYYDFGRDSTDGFFGFSGAQTTFSGYKWSVNAGTEVMRITNGGNVGIGTSSPGSKLDVSSSSFNIVSSRSTTSFAAFQRFAPSGQTAYDFYSINGVEAARIAVDGSNIMSFATGSAAAERMRITSTGNVGIGTSGPSSRLQVNASSGSTQVAYFVNDSVGSTLAGIVASIESGGNNTNSFHFAGVTQTVALWYLYGNGTTSYTSDIRVKKNVTTTRDGYLEDVCKLRVVKYNWYNDSDDTPRELGFIAQEVEQVFPGLVQDALHPTKDGEIHKVLKGSVMMPIMLKALQEANAKIDALTARVAQLEGN